MALLSIPKSISVIHVLLAVALTGCARTAADSSQTTQGTASATDIDQIAPAAGAPSDAGGFQPVATRRQQPSGRRTGTMLWLDPAVVVDGYGQDRPMAAFTLFVPHGWKPVAPGVVWGPQFACTDYYNFDWRAVSPDRVSAVGILPMANWEYNNTGNPRALRPGCTSLQISDVQGYLTAAVQRYWPGARILDFRRDPAASTPPTPMQMVAGQGESHVDAGEVLFAYTANGQDMRGTAKARVTFSNVQLPAPGRSDLQFMNASAEAGLFVVAPNGQLNVKLASAIAKSVQLNPPWIRLMTDYIRRLRAGEQIAERQRQGIWQNTNAQIAQMRSETWDANQRSSDARARAASESLRDVQTYKDPDVAGGTTELSNAYSGAWRLKDGSYALSNDVNFDPYRDLGIDGQKLEPTR